MSKSIFISHSSKDKNIAKAIVDLIADGIGVPEKEIFCSSVEGHKIPSGQDFLLYIKNEMEQPKIVILLLTRSYWKSEFCLCEMGAAWVKSHQIFPILVPPLNNNDLKAVLSTTQAFQIDDKFGYNDIRDYLSQELKLNEISITKWEIRKQEFLDKLPNLINESVIPEEISIEKFLSLQSQFQKSQAELNKYQQENQNLHIYIKKLENLKNTDEVNTIKQELKITTTGTSEQFEAQVEQIKNQLQEITFEKEVSICILSKYYKQPYRVDHKARRTGFPNAESNGYIQIDLDDSGKIQDIKVLWNTKEMALLKQQLEELKKFLEEVQNIEELQFYVLEEYEVEVDPEIPRFWKKVYNL